MFSTTRRIRGGFGFHPRPSLDVCCAVHRRRSLCPKAVPKEARKHESAPSGIAVCRGRWYRDKMVVNIACPMPALDEHSGIGRKGRSMPGRIRKGEVSTRLDPVAVAGEHLTRVHVRVALRPHTVYPPLDEDELPNNEYAEDEVDEDGARSAARDVCPGVGELFQLFAREGPTDDGTDDEQDLPDEDQDCCDTQTTQAWNGFEQFTDPALLVGIDRGGVGCRF